eukprot:2326567-Pleurochrysis_carterae.AAC.1
MPSHIAGTSRATARSVTNLLNVDITTGATSVHLKPEKAHLVSTYLPEGVPLSFRKSRTPASESLFKLVKHALLFKPIAPLTPNLFPLMSPSSARNLLLNTHPTRCRQHSSLRVRT